MVDNHEHEQHSLYLYAMLPCSVTMKIQSRKYTDALPHRPTQIITNQGLSSLKNSHHNHTVV